MLDVFTMYALPCNKLLITTDDIPVILWVTFDGFCKHTDCLCVLALLHQLYPLFCQTEKMLINNSLASQ